jgi:hypothetical protein
MQALADSRQSDRRGAAMSREHLRLAESRPNELQAALSPLITLITRQLSDGMTAPTPCGASQISDPGKHEHVFDRVAHVVPDDRSYHAF